MVYLILLHLFWATFHYLPDGDNFLYNTIRFNLRDELAAIMWPSGCPGPALCPSGLVWLAKTIPTVLPHQVLADGSERSRWRDRLSRYCLSLLELPLAANQSLAQLHILSFHLTVISFHQGYHLIDMYSCSIPSRWKASMHAGNNLRLPEPSPMKAL